MTSSFALFVLSAAFAAPPLPAAAPIDPYLPASLVPAVTRASEAERDPKRGPENAVQILEAERPKLTAGSPEDRAIDLRVAATRVRKRMLLVDEFPELARREQALSTFARLDLAEPGLVPALDAALALRPDVKKVLGPRGRRALPVAILTRGSALDRQEIARVFGAALDHVGMKLEVVPAEHAHWVITLAAEDASGGPASSVAVRLSFRAESIREGHVDWKSELFRIEAAPEARTAVASALEWMSRIGGRDLFFRFLGESGLSLLLDPHLRAPGGAHRQADAPRAGAHDGARPTATTSVPSRVKIGPDGAGAGASPDHRW